MTTTIEVKKTKVYPERVNEFSFHYFVQEGVTLPRGISYDDEEALASLFRRTLGDVHGWTHAAFKDRLLNDLPFSESLLSHFPSMEEVYNNVTERVALLEVDFHFEEVESYTKEIPGWIKVERYTFGFKHWDLSNPVITKKMVCWK
jgi:hypothetical protein